MSMPGGQRSRRPMYIYFLADVSGSMTVDGKIQQLNFAAQEALPHMRAAAEDNARTDVFVRVLAFSDEARWLSPTPVPLDHFVWPELHAGGMTSLGAALTLLADDLARLPSRARRPVVLALTDGEPTDDWEAGLARLLSEPAGRAATRLAIALEGDVNFDVLQRFIADPSVQPMRARNVEQLVALIKWASTAPLAAEGRPLSAPPVEVPADAGQRVGPTWSAPAPGAASWGGPSSSQPLTR